MNTTIIIESFLNIQIQFNTSITIFALTIIELSVFLLSKIKNGQ